jgi:RNA polymerase sigma factor (sigma-70 family)
MAASWGLEMVRLSDEQQRVLLERARSGPVAERTRSLEQLLADFRGPALAAIHKTLASCGVDAAHAEEALQEAIFKFIGTGIAAYRGGAAPRTYFTRIAINAALDVGRRMARVRFGGLAGIEESELAVSPSAEQGIAAQQTRRALEACIEELPERYHAAIRLYYLEEAGDCATCAAQAGVSREAFMQQLCRARVMLARCLERKLGVTG